MSLPVRVLAVRRMLLKKKKKKKKSVNSYTELKNISCKNINKIQTRCVFNSPRCQFSFVFLDVEHFGARLDIEVAWFVHLFD